MLSFNLYKENNRWGSKRLIPVVIRGLELNLKLKTIVSYDAHYLFTVQLRVTVFRMS